jgi:hypothetical protein
MLDGRAVTPSRDAVILCGNGPRFGGGLGRHPVVSPLAEERVSGVVQMFQVWGEVGFSPKQGDELFPGCSSLKLTSQRAN